MGFPLSRFQMLSRLCADDKAVRASLASFKLKCIVLHDPDDKQFAARMRKSFMDLHEKTGKDLLFITFITPPKKWKDSIDQRFEYIDPERLYAEPGFDDWLIIRHLLPSVAPDANLPCLLITDDLMSREYLLLESSVDRFEEQLTELGNYCLQADGRFPVSDRRFQEFASTLGTGRLSLLPDRSLAAALSDVLALEDLGHRNHEAERWTERRIQELKAGGADSVTASFRYESAVNREKKLAELPKPPIDAMANRSDPSHRHYGYDEAVRPPSLYSSFLFSPPTIRGYHLCDVRSRSNILEYNDALEVFVPKRTRDESKVAFIDRRQTMRRSFKQLAQPLAELFEREINFTLIQLMRWHCGIEMPEFYRKFKRNCFVCISTPRVEVGLNACEYPDRLKSVMLGNAYYAYEAMCDPFGPYRMQERMGEAFLQEWDKMVYMRNKIDHADYYEEDFFGYDEFRHFHAVFTSILRDSLWKMEAIGEALRSGADLPEFDRSLTRQAQ